MPTPSPQALDFLRARRSVPPKTMTGPAPTPSELAPLLEAALRVPDHGKLEPWRLVVIEKGAMGRLADLAEARAQELGDAEKLAKARGQFDQGVLIVAVISSPKPHPKVPLSEQQASAACVCLSLVNAALASGWAAAWLTGWVSHDPEFSRAAFDLAEGETVAGLVHIGRETSPVPDRPRPDVAALTRWLSA